MRVGLVVCLAAVLAGCGSDGPATLQFLDVSPTQPQLGQVTTVRFVATDSRGQPAAGVTVTFALQSDQPGVTLTPTSGTTTKEGGVVQTQLVATGHVNSVVVQATAGDKVALSPPITFAGSAPSSSQFTFQCGEFDGVASGGVHAIRAYDPTRHLTAGVKVHCTAHVADRNGDGIPNAQVSFLTEAGTIGPTETTQSDVIGNATVLYKTSLPLPEDVDPGTFTWTPTNDDTHTGEYLVPLWMHPYLWSENPIANYLQEFGNLNEPRRTDPERLGPNNTPIINNPRDNLVSMIAVTAGEEAFEDLNNNGQYDEGEPFTDLTEPFVDSNDNGTWDEGERYIDTNNNGQWDGKNGKFDANTLIWVQERILWTGLPDVPDYLDAVAPVFSPIDPVGGGGKPINPAFGSVSYTYLISDPWFNTMAQNGTSDGCQVITTGPVVGVISKGPVGQRLTYPPFDTITMTITDSRTPPAAGDTLPLAGYTAYTACQLTDSPIEGGVIMLPGLGVSSTVAAYP